MAFDFLEAAKAGNIGTSGLAQTMLNIRQLKQGDERLTLARRSVGLEERRFESGEEFRNKRFTAEEAYRETVLNSAADQAEATANYRIEQLGYQKNLLAAQTERFGETQQAKIHEDATAYASNILQKGYARYSENVMMHNQLADEKDKRDLMSFNQYQQQNLSNFDTNYNMYKGLLGGEDLSEMLAQQQVDFEEFLDLENKKLEAEIDTEDFSLKETFNRIMSSDYPEVAKENLLKTMSKKLNMSIDDIKEEANRSGFAAAVHLLRRTLREDPVFSGGGFIGLNQTSEEKKRSQTIFERNNAQFLNTTQ